MKSKIGNVKKIHEIVNRFHEFFPGNGNHNKNEFSEIKKKKSPDKAN